MIQGRILLLRHGRIPQSEPRRFVGQRDLPLDEVGRAQAEGVRAYLAPIPVARVVSSDLCRARETAEIVMAGQGPEIEREPRLREICLGRWEGLSSGEVRGSFPGEYEARGRDMARFRPQGGESFEDLAARAWPAFEALAAATRGVTLVVAHAGVNRVILCRLLGLPLEHLFRLGQDYCCLNLIALHESGPVLERLNLAVSGKLW